MITIRVFNFDDTHNLYYLEYHHVPRSLNITAEQLWQQANPMLNPKDFFIRLIRAGNTHYESVSQDTQLYNGDFIQATHKRIKVV